MEIHKRPDGWFIKKIKPEVLKKTEGHCYWCGKKLKESFDTTIDHLLQLCMGGNNDIQNLVPSCRSCNSAKGCMDEPEFREYLIKISDRKMSILGRFGGSNTLKKHGKEHFSRIAKLSWEKRKKVINS